MSLSPGALGSYEIVSPLGAGGMGEVYRTRDTRLERTVAVKVLPQHLCSSEESRQRSERGVRAPCCAYDLGPERKKAFQASFGVGGGFGAR